MDHQTEGNSKFAVQTDDDSLHSENAGIDQVDSPISRGIQKNFFSVFRADARKVPVARNSVDLILTSPPYWQKRDYEIKKQIGQEKTVRRFVGALTRIMEGWKDVLKPTGSVFINIGDSYKNGLLLEIPSLLIDSATKKDWQLRHRIIWEKPNSTPHSAARRLAQREEYILHFTLSNKYYTDLEGYKEKYEAVTNIWRMHPAYHKGGHLAPFPEELAERILLLSCPKYVCSKCNLPLTREVEKTAELDELRPQARRALAIYKESKLTPQHIEAVQAVGISDAGKAIKFQTGAGKNGKNVQKLASEAKEILGGYFREFTFAKKRTTGWKACQCQAALKPGVVYDPFLGTGTTLTVARKLGLSAIGSDLKIYDDLLKRIA